MLLLLLLMLLILVMLLMLLILLLLLLVLLVLLLPFPLKSNCMTAVCGPLAFQLLAATKKLLVSAKTS